MYKVEREILVKITRFLDQVSRAGKSDDKKTFTRRLKASKLSKLIKDNYTEIK